VKCDEPEAAQHVAVLIQLTRQESGYGSKQGTPEDSLEAPESLGTKINKSTTTTTEVNLSLSYWGILKLVVTLR